MHTANSFVEVHRLARVKALNHEAENATNVASYTGIHKNWMFKIMELLIPMGRITVLLIGTGFNLFFRVQGQV